MVFTIIYQPDNHVYMVTSEIIKGVANKKEAVKVFLQGQKAQAKKDDRSFGGYLLAVVKGSHKEAIAFKPYGIRK